MGHAFSLDKVLLYGSHFHFVILSFEMISGSESPKYELKCFEVVFCIQAGFKFTRFDVM